MTTLTFHLTFILLLFFSLQYSVIADINFVEKTGASTIKARSEKITNEEVKEEKSNAEIIKPEEIKEEKPNTEIIESEEIEQKPSYIKKDFQKKIIPKKVNQYEIEGYANSKYVRISIEIDENGEIVGNIFNAKGKMTYIHGEHINNSLELYDGNGEQYTIIVTE